tara:strand:- start:2022 stop:4583 length:2562 start_codon:yes stop_codon:yes gene_type:complete
MPIWSPAFFGSAGATGYVVEDSIYLDGSADFFTQSFSSSGNRNTYTRSFWVKRAKLGDQQKIFDTGPDGGNNVESLDFDSSDRLQWVINDSNATKYMLVTTQVFRDTTAWYHIVCARDTATMKMYVNGVEITDFGTNVNTGASNVGRWTHTDQNNIGRYFLSASRFLSAYLAEVVQIDGQILTPTSFGEFNDEGLWIPIDVSGLTFGTNGFYLQFKQTGSGQDASGIGADTSGVGRHWAVGGGSPQSNQVTDTCTNDADNNIGNFPTFNPLNNYSSVTFKNGNLTASNSSSSVTSFMTQPFRVGGSETTKVYFEMQTGDQDSGFGFIPADSDITGGLNLGGSGGISVYGVMQEGTNRLRELDGSSNANHDVFSGSRTWNQSTDRLCCALDLATGKMWGGFFDASEDTVEWTDGSTGYTGDPANGNNPVFTLPAGAYILGVRVYNSADNNFNFGQTAYAKTPPTGFGDYSTATMAEPTVTDSSVYFQNVLYTGNSGTQAITLIGNSDMQPDFVWLKNRSGTYAFDHVLFDSVRGVQKGVSSNLSDAQNSSRELTAFNSDGFTLVHNASDFKSNVSGHTYVGWCWKAGGAPTADNSGGASPTNNSIMIDGSANTSTLTTSNIYPKRASGNNTSGFGVIRYTGNGSSSTQTLANPFSWSPDVIFCKNLEAGDDWEIFHVSLGHSGNSRMYLNKGDAASGASRINAVSTTQITFVASTSGCNPSSQDVIMYAWARTPNVCAAGKYTGGGSTHPNIIVDDGGTGFKPAWLMIKNASTSSRPWVIYDNKRSNVVNPQASNSNLLANENHKEATVGTFAVDFTATGFKLKGAEQTTNADGETFIYLAFAESPFAVNNRAK